LPQAAFNGELIGPAKETPSLEGIKTTAPIDG